MNNIADQSELSDESQEKISGEEIINLIKENLGKKYFSSHKDMIEFLKIKGYVYLNLVFLII